MKTNTEKLLEIRKLKLELLAKKAECSSLEGKILALSVKYQKEKKDTDLRGRLNDLVGMFWDTDYFGRTVKPYSTKRTYVDKLMSIYDHTDIKADLALIESRGSDIEELAELFDENVNERVDMEEGRKAGVENL